MTPLVLRAFSSQKPHFFPLQIGPFGGVMIHHVGGAAFGFKCHKLMNCIDLKGSLREVWLQVCFGPFPWS
jgi:hypothetical protein